MNSDWRNGYFETLAAAMADFGYRNPRTRFLVRTVLVTPPPPEEVYAVRTGGDDVRERLQRKGYSPANELHQGAHITARVLRESYDNMPACMMLWHLAVAFWLDQKMSHPDFQDPCWSEICWLMRQIEGEPIMSWPWQPGDNPFAVDMRRIPIPRASVHWLACMTATIAVMNAHAFEIVTIC